MICSSVGFLLFGNIYDNYDKPRLLTTALILSISLLSLLEAIFTGSSSHNLEYDKDVL